jgi:hypothetical protein
MPQLTGPQVYTSTIDDYTSQLVPTNLNAWDKTLKKLKAHPTIKIARYLSIAPAIIAKWTTEGDAPKEAHEHIAEKILPHQTSILSDAMLGMIDWGWAPFERVLDDQQCFKYLKPLLQTLSILLVDPENGELLGVHQERTTHCDKEVDLYEPDAVVFTQQVVGQEWYGRGDTMDAEAAYNSWLDAETVAKKYDAKTAGAHWVIKYPLGTSRYNDTDMDNGLIAKDILDKLTANGNIAIPAAVQRFIGPDNPETDAWSIELMESSSNTSTSLDVRLRYCDVLMCRAFCLPERMLTEGTHGTKAEAEQHADVAMTYIEMRRDHVLEKVNRLIVQPELMTHFGPGVKLKLVPEPMNAEQREYLRTVYDKILSTPEGFLAELDDLDINALRDHARVPSKKIVDDVDP